MPEGQVPTTPPTDGQVPPTTPPVTDPVTTPTDGQNPPAMFDAAYVESLRREAAANRVAAKKASDALEAMKAAQMTDAERAAARLKELEAAQTAWETERRALTTQAEVERQARKLGIVDEDAAARLIDTGQITYDDAGKPVNVEALLAELVRARPWLKAADQPQSTAPTSPTNAQRTNAGRTLTRADIAKMTPDQINANWDAVQEVLKSGR